MAFVVGPSDTEEQARFSKYILEQQKQVTELAGRNGAVVFVVADYLVEELENLRFPSRPLNQSELAEVLGPRGLKAYRNMQAVSPELLSLDGRLPAPGMRPVKLFFHESDLPVVQEILGQRTRQKVEGSECFAAYCGECLSLLVVEVDLPTSECDAVGQELQDRGVIGVHPLARMFLGRDPDR